MFLMSGVRGGVAHWVARLTRDRWNLSVVSSSPIKGPHCFLEQETLLSLLSTGWFQERIRVCLFHNQTKINQYKLTNEQK